MNDWQKTIATKIDCACCDYIEQAVLDFFDATIKANTVDIKTVEKLANHIYLLKKAAAAAKQTVARLTPANDDHL